MRRSGFLLFTVLAVLLTTTYSHAVLPADEALEKPVTLAVKGEALSDIIPMLQEQTGVRLQAGRDIADQKATIFVDNKPLRQVMDGLSTLFGYHWTKKTFSTGDTYELWEDEKSRIQGEETRRKAWLESWKLALADIQSTLKAVGTQPEDQEDSDVKLRAEAAKGSDEAKAKLRLFNEAAKNPLYVPCAKVFLSLPAEAYNLLGPGVTVRYHAASKEQEWQLPEGFARDILSRLQRGVGASASGTQPYDISLCIKLGDSGKSVDVRGELSCYTQSQPGLFQSSGYTVFLADRKLADAVSAVATLPRVAEGDPAQKQVEATREDLEKAGGRLWQKTGPDKLWLTRSDMLSVLHDKLGLQIISDHCSHWDIQAYGTKQSVGEMLGSYDKQSQVPGEDLSQAVWGWDGGILYMRSKDPVQARASEVPNRDLRRWTSIYKSQGFLGIDEQAEISLLAPAQRTGLTLARRFMDLPREGALGPDTLRLYGVLTPEQRKKVFADSLPVAELTEPQVGQLAKLLPNNMNSGGVRVGDIPPCVGIWRDDVRLDKQVPIDPRSLPVLVRMRQKEKSADPNTAAVLSASVSAAGWVPDTPTPARPGSRKTSDIEYSMVFSFTEENTVEHIISIPGPEAQPETTGSESK